MNKGCKVWIPNTFIEGVWTLRHLTIIKLRADLVISWVLFKGKGGKIESKTPC